MPLLLLQTINRLYPVDMKMSQNRIFIFYILFWDIFMFH